MSSKYNINLTGRTFKKLIVIKGLDEYTVNNGYKGYQKWLCRCSCGREVKSNSYALLRGESEGCGISGCGGKYHVTPELVGKIFGKLTVIKLLPERRNTARDWLCECACGNLKNVKTQMLTNGQTTHCGCSFIKYNDRTIPVKKYLYCNYKRNARNRNLDFNITFEEFCAHIESSCFYCGDAPSNIGISNRQYRTLGRCAYNGIDRIDNNSGYVYGNCVPCCSSCNSAKGNSSLETFIGYIEKLKESK